MKLRTLRLMCFLFAAVTLGSAACTQAFSALSVNGVQYNVQSAQNYPPPVLSGIVPLNVQFRIINESAITPAPTGISLRYTVDNQPVGPVLTDNFAWNLDTTSLAEGTHALSVLYVNEAPQNPCYTFIGRQYAFVVSNSGKPVAGSQLLPVISPPPANGAVAPQFADFVTYPGYQPHAPGHPFPYQFVPPAGGVTPTDFWAEMLVSSISNTGEGKPDYWQLKNGSIVEDPLFTGLLGCDDLRKPTWEFDVWGPSREQRKAHFDGTQDNASLSSYVKFTANLDGPGFYGLSMDGQLFRLNMDGGIQTLAGWSSQGQVTPYHYLDNSIPMSQVHSQRTLVGNFDALFYFPTDLATDPRNHNHIFVADMNNHRIALADLSQSPPKISTYAGVVGNSGYVNGPALSAMFNQPSSLAIAADGTMYVADAENAAIRKIDPSGNVTTLVGLGPASEPSTNTVAASPLTYAPRSAAPFSSAYINYPNAIRFDSKGNLVLAETVSQTIRYIDLTAKTVTTIAQFSSIGSAYGEHVWIDVDRNGNVGARDDIIATMVAAHSNGLYRVPITGTTSIPLPTLTPHGTSPMYHGHTLQSALPWTSDPWAIAIDDQEGRLLVSGVQSSGVASLRVLQPSDPAYNLKLAYYTAGRAIWVTGTVPNFPFGSRPSFAAVHGYQGHSGLGNVQNFDDMVSMTDAQLGSYLQNGADGSTPRPELTGNDLRNLIYYIRRTATGGDLVTPGPGSTDQAPPAISGIASSQSSATSANVNWTTSKSSLGFVNWGTSSGTYFGWSPIESAYATSHGVSITNLPAGQTIYFVVFAKDQAGNQTMSPEQSLTLH